MISAGRILAERMKNAISGDPRLVENTINDFISRGYLKADHSDKGCNWRWA